MPYVSNEMILKARQTDLLTFLQNYNPDELVRVSRNTYCTKEHDSLKISNGKWYWFSQNIGGVSALDYLVKVKGFDFIKAVEIITKQSAIITSPRVITKVEKDKPLLLPEKSPTNDVITKYLKGRGIDEEIIDYCIENKLIMESLPYHNLVFLGYDKEQNIKYAAYRATNKSRVMGDCSGSKKDYSFRLLGTNDNEVHLFESAIDLLSYATLLKMNNQDFKEFNLLSLSGVYSPSKNLYDSKLPKAIENYLENYPNITRVIMHLDNDRQGKISAEGIKIALPYNLQVVNDPPIYGKDVNDFLCFKLKIKSKNERNYER